MNNQYEGRSLSLDSVLGHLMTFKKHNTLNKPRERCSLSLYLGLITQKLQTITYKYFTNGVETPYNPSKTLHIDSDSDAQV